MIDGSVIPDGQVVDMLPLEADLEVVVLHNQLDKPVEEVLALLVREAVDALDVVADGEHGLPPRYWVGSNEGVNGLENLADVLGSAAGGRVDGEVVALGGVVEERLSVVSSKSVEELPQLGGDAIVELIT